MNDGRKVVKLLHVITGLKVGGAEIALHKLLSSLDPGSFQNTVISLTERGPIGERIADLGVEVTALGMNRDISNPVGFIRLARAIRRSRPDLVHAWMYDADVLSGMASCFSGRPPLIWEIRHVNLDPQKNRRRTIWMMKVGAMMSGWLPKVVVYNSETARTVHIERGYAASRSVVIPNGFDTVKFLPYSGSSRDMRERYRIPDDALVVGHVGRYHPQKDHLNFIRAAAQVLACEPRAFFVLCGENVTFENACLAEQIDVHGLRERCLLLGRCAEMTRLFHLFDLTVSSSVGESFPNCIGESMACGVPCVVTNVGDSAAVVGDTGYAVREADPVALSSAIMKMLSLGDGQRKALGASARQRIVECYSLEIMGERYEALYKKLLMRCARFFSRNGETSHS